MGRRKLDKFDLEAEREGSAIEKFNSQAIKPTRSKRLRKQVDNTKLGVQKQENRIQKRHLK